MNKFSHADINRMVKEALDAKSGKGVPQSPLERLRALMQGAKNKMGIPQREL